MKTGKKIISVLIGVILIVVFMSIVNTENNACCERTKDGMWCQDAPESECDTDYESVPSSCESTSYCKLGCCYNSDDGTCTPNTPQRVCEDNGGKWDNSSDCDIGQCQKGCCLMGDQAAFVTQVRCKRLSSLYGLETNYRTDITSESECIASASSDVEGACVYTEDYEKTCERTTKEECNEIEQSKGDDADVKFHEGYLCSAEELGTNCGPTEETTCVEGKEEVYFEDSCGNIANIYDASKIEDDTYWKYIAEQTSEIDVCGQEDSNADSAKCGNCDYYLGSTCKEYQRNEDRVKPNYGDYICRDLGCEYKGEEYEHGETWCAESEGVEDNLPGSRYFRLVCYNGEVSVEPCADFRQETCVESEVNESKTAGCVANKWEPCTGIEEKDECESSQNDCEWLGDEMDNIEEPKCVPENSPGLEFWNEEEEEDSEDVCSAGEIECKMEFTKGTLDSDYECDENCHCQTKDWQEKMLERCSLLGDCEGSCEGDECNDNLEEGLIKNYIGVN